MSGMQEPVDLERVAIERDRDLAWELYDAQPKHPQIPRLTQSVLARAPQFTGMIILLAMHREACGEFDEARRLLQDLMGRRDRQFLGALRKLRDLEHHERRYDESLRLAELVLREDPEADWLDRMDLGSAMSCSTDPEGGWRMIDEAVDLSARTDPARFPQALGQRALRFLASGAPPERFIPAAQQAIEADPSETLIETALAYAFLYDYRAEEAADAFRRVLRADPLDEVAQGGLYVAKAFLDPIERGVGTMDDLRNAGMGRIAWRMLRDQLFETGVAEALAALDAVMPDDLARSLRPPLDDEAARVSGGEYKVLAWHDGQLPGSGAAWGQDDPFRLIPAGQTNPFRLMSAEEIAAMDAEIEQDPEAWPLWNDEREYYTQIFTDDAGAYLNEGSGGRLFQRGVGDVDREIAPSLADWLWDRVVAFGGDDPRPGGSAVASLSR